MMIGPKIQIYTVTHLRLVEKIGANEALDILRRDGRLENIHIEGELDIAKLGEFDIDKLGHEIDYPLEFRNCEFEYYFSTTQCHAALVVWDHCVFRKIRLFGTHFWKGLTCRDCELLSEFSWDAGGHNSPETPILFERVKFHKFADFFDCLFQGPVILRDVEFIDGTNLINKEFGWVSFEYTPVLERVKGELDQQRNRPRLGVRHLGYIQDPNGWWVPAKGRSRKGPKPKRSWLQGLLKK
jgi:hypothetical protein